MSPLGMPTQRRPPQPKTPVGNKARTVQYREWKGANLTDARVAIDDQELFWLENAMTIGKGAIQIIPGPGPIVATIAAGIATLWGFVLDGIPLFISVNNDGSMSQITPGGAVTAVAPAATVGTDADLTIWQTSPILIVDAGTGYHKWDGATFTTIDASKTGNGIAVFEGRVWIASSRTITYTSPATFDDFDPTNGAGSTVITDEAFVGNIEHLISALEQLWILSPASVETISNVQTTGTPPDAVTTFSTTNITTGLGSNAPHSVIGYFRALTFKAPFGIYALSGVTPQKLSDKLDGMFEAIDLIDGDAPAAIAVVRSLLVLCTLIEYTPSDEPSLPTPASGETGASRVLLCFTQGKWFFGTQGDLDWITTLPVDGVLQAWGTDGLNIYQLFGGGDDPVAHKIVSKLYDFGASTTNKQVQKIGIEVQAREAINPTITIDSEISSETEAISLTNTLTFVGMGPITFVGTGPITWITTGMVLGRSVANMRGQFIGWTIQGTDPPYRLQTVQFEIVPSREWNTPTGGVLA